MEAFTGTGPMLGATIPPMETRREVVVHAAQRAEELGYDAFFVTEAWGFDATVVLAEIAMKTERILLGTGVVNVWSRSGAALAMAAATLSELSDGRFVLGLGASTPQLTEGLHDTSFTAPFDQMRRVLTQARDLLAGGRVALSETRNARPLRLAVRPETVPVVLGGLAPASVRLAGELADGWMPFLYPASHLDAGISLLHEGADRSRRSSGSCVVCPAVAAAVADDPASARSLAAWWVHSYLTTMGPLYARNLRHLGYSREVDAVLSAGPPSPTSDVPAEADALLHELVIIGTPATARRGLARWYEAGTRLLTVALPPNRPWEDLELALSALAPPPQPRPHALAGLDACAAKGTSSSGDEP